MVNLLAQTPTPVQVPAAGDFWNPSNWAPFVKEIGIPGFFAIVLFGFFIWIMSRGLTKWDRHLTRQEKLTATHLALCRQVHGAGGVSNISDFRDAGHELVDALQEIADGIGPDTGEAVKPRVSRIHQTLRNVPPPLPTLDLASNGD